MALKACRPSFPALLACIQPQTWKALALTTAFAFQEIVRHRSTKLLIVMSFRLAAAWMRLLSPTEHRSRTAVLGIAASSRAPLRER